MIDIITKFDFKILDYIYKNLHTPFLDKIMPLITSLGNAGIVWIIITIVLISTKKYREGGIKLILALINCLLICNIFIKPIIARIRPYDVNTLVELLVKKQLDFSFPSGHTAASFVSTVVLMSVNKKLGIFGLILSILIAISRIYLYLHYPSDVLAGVIIGITIGIITIKFIAPNVIKFVRIKTKFL